MDRRIVSMKFAIRITITGLALLVLTAIHPIGASAAPGWTVGYTYWGKHKIPTTDTYVPAGQLMGVIEGSGLTPRVLGGNFLTYSGSICNWHIDADFLDQDGKRYYRWQGANHGGPCAAFGQERYSMGRDTVRPGRICIRLYTDFTRYVDSVCFSIHR